MELQTLIVGVIVAGSVFYASWSLMPAGLRRALAQRALRWPLPDWAARPFQRAATPASGCGACGGCEGNAPPKKHPAVQTVTFHRRRP